MIEAVQNKFSTPVQDFKGTHNRRGIPDSELMIVIHRFSCSPSHPSNSVQVHGGWLRRNCGQWAAGAFVFIESLIGSQKKLLRCLARFVLRRAGAKLDTHAFASDPDPKWPEPL
jgi:hypothetical protein